MPEANKTVKVDQAVHDELNRLKDKYGADTFNGVLRRELGITPDVDLDDLTAYYQEDLRELAKNLVEMVTEIEALDVGLEVDEDASNNHVLRFVSHVSDREIARIVFSETGFDVKYRDQSGKMEFAQSAHRYKPSTDIIHGGGVGTGRMVEEVKDKVVGANRRWG